MAFNSSPSSTLEELFEKVTAYEELKCAVVANEVNKAFVNVVTDYIPREDKKKPNDKIISFAKIVAPIMMATHDPSAKISPDPITKKCQNW